jgi:hypothetical protein
LMAGDSTSQAGVDTARFNSLAITPNEIRAEDGRNPIEGGDSLFLNTAYLPLNVAIAKAVAATSTTPPITPTPTGIDTEDDEGDNTPPGNPDAGIKPASGEPGPATPADLIDDERSSILKPLIRDAFSRIVRRQTKIVESSIVKPNFNIAEFIKNERNHIAEVMQPLCEAAATAGIKLRSDYIDCYLASTQADIEQVIACEADLKSDAMWLMRERWNEKLDESVKLFLGTNAI